MITFESPVVAVVGEAAHKRKRIEEGLGLRTVGDLMNHFPRRYVRTGELTRVGELRVGQLLTVVGEIVASDLRTYQDRRTGRPAYRLETVLATDGQRLRMTFFAKNQRVASSFETKYARGRRGLFLGQVGRFRDEWQLTNPQMFLFGSDDIGAVIEIPPFYPIYPLTKGVQTWDLERAVSFARTVVEVPDDVLPEAVRREHGILDLRAAYDQVHAPDDYPQVTAAHRPVPVRGGAGHPARARPAPAHHPGPGCPGPRRRRRCAARRLRRPAALRAHPGPAGRWASRSPPTWPSRTR